MCSGTRRYNIRRGQADDGVQNKFGGGDPDRTGDPRLMSPLLCQLSYTATSKELICEEHNFTRGGISLSTEERQHLSMVHISL